MFFENGEIDPNLPNSDDFDNSIERFQAYVRSRLEKVQSSRKLQLLENLGVMQNLPNGAKEFLEDEKLKLRPIQ